MATGFKEIQRNSVVKSKGYKTLFEKITEKTGGEKKSLSWYMSQVKEESSRYKKDSKKLIRDEKKDTNDENVLRRYTVAGHLYMFEYKAKSRWLPYYDKFPLVYVMKSNGGEFWGANLHYMNPKRRIIAIKKLMEGRVDMPKACFHKYLGDHVNGFYLDLAAVEWDTAILLPVEDFVRNVKGSVFPYERELVWEETNENLYDRIKGRRVIQGYGKSKDIQMVK
jgi:hypothetical protein